MKKQLHDGVLVCRISAPLIYLYKTVLMQLLPKMELHDAVDVYFFLIYTFTQQTNRQFYDLNNALKSLCMRPTCIREMLSPHDKCWNFALTVIFAIHE